MYFDVDSRCALLEINHLTKKDAGVYLLKAENNLGSDSAQFTIEVSGRFPRLPKHPYLRFASYFAESCDSIGVKF